MIPICNTYSITKTNRYDIMRKLENSLKNIENSIESKGEQGGRLSSNNVNVRCSSLDSINNNATTEDELIKYIAGVLVEGFLWQYEHADKYQ